MYLIHEDLARAQCQERLRAAREERRVRQLRRAQRLNRRADRARDQARLLLARAQ